MQVSNSLDRELLLKESEWVWSEMEDFVRQIQRYRLSYATALFASLGWILGHLVEPENRLLTLDAVRARGDIAAVLLLVPMLNGLFFLLMMEAARQVQSLARYRFLLGCALGDGTPRWRWEVFKLTPEGSIRAWTNPSNVFLAILVLTLTGGVYWFVLPAVALGLEVKLMMWASGAYTAALGVSIGVAGLKSRKANDVADEIRDVSYGRLEAIWREQRCVVQDQDGSVVPSACAVLEDVPSAASPTAAGEDERPTS